FGIGFEGPGGRVGVGFCFPGDTATLDAGFEASLIVVSLEVGVAVILDGFEMIFDFSPEGVAVMTLDDGGFEAAAPGEVIFEDFFPVGVSNLTGDLGVVTTTLDGFEMIFDFGSAGGVVVLDGGFEAAPGEAIFEDFFPVGVSNLDLTGDLGVVTTT